MFKIVFLVKQLEYELLRLACSPPTVNHPVAFCGPPHHLRCTRQCTADTILSDNLFVESGLGGRCAGIIFYTSELIVFSEEDTFIMNDVMYSSSARLPEEARETVLEYMLKKKKKRLFRYVGLNLCYCAFDLFSGTLTMVSSQCRHVDALTTLRCHWGQLPCSW